MSELPKEEREIRDEESEPSSEEEGEDVMDSSQEEDEEDDEEAMQKVREGFIVDDDEVEERRRKKRSKKRKREETRNTVDDALDEDDLELLMENSGARPEGKGAGKLKRLKRAHLEARENGEQETGGGLRDMFSDDEGLEEAEVLRDKTGDRNILDEFEDFIEDDEFSDEGEARERNRQQRELTKRSGPRLDTSKLSSVDRESLQQLFEVFGNGTEYEWALEAQEMEDEGNAENLEPTSLDEVFEHSELKERMLTEEDNMIRVIDVPERLQKYRMNLNYIDLEEEELKREQSWVANLLFIEKQGSLSPQLEGPFKEAVSKVVEFVSKDSYEVPFIWTHRRDFLLYSEEVSNEDGTVNNNVHKLLFEDDLWRIVKLDNEYHSLYAKRLNVEQIIYSLKLDDDLAKDTKSLDTMVGIQDLHDYINFTYSSQIKDLSSQKENDESEKSNKKHSKFAIFERIRENVLYDGVKAFGISAKEFGENVQDQSAKKFEVPYRIHATDDYIESPQDLIEKVCEDDEVLYKDPDNALNAIRKTFAEEIFHNPKIRSEVRMTYKNFAVISVSITDKGKATIDNYSPYADIKYAINRTPSDLVREPDLFLRMLEAESAGLVVLKVRVKDYENWFQCIFNCLKSDGSSEISEKWNQERELLLRLAFKRLTSMVSLNTKEDLRRECERLIAIEIRRHFLAVIDQAPYTPFGFDKGTKPNVLALSFGKGDFDNAVVGAFLRDSGKVDDYFKSDSNPIRDRDSEEKFLGQLKEFFEKIIRVKPDVIAISGFNPNSKKLFDMVKSFIELNNITCNVEDLSEVENPPLIPVIWCESETANLYQNSEKAKIEFSDKPPLYKFCIGLGRYIQSPLLEYVSLNDNVLSLEIYKHQKLIPNELIMEAVESAFVDIVNMVGVEINVAVRDPYIAQLLPYVSGLGPRKASGLIRNINTKLGSTLLNRSELIESELCTANIFINCSSFLNIPYDANVSLKDNSVELLDATRIHPEDYDLARKMAADALDLDEEDMSHVEEHGGIIYQLMQEGVTKVDDLNLTAYGKELESKFGKKKYATLQTIKEELVNNYEEIRRSFHILDVSEIFHMLTGETIDSFCRNTIVPVTINKVGQDLRNFDNARIRFLKVTTTSLILGNIEESYIPRGSQFAQGQVVQAVVLEAHYETFTATFSLLETDIKKALTPKFKKEPQKWDFDAEEADRKLELAKEKAKLAKTRNIQHPLFHNFNYKQAEEYLAPQSVGDCVLRPSSKGPDYLTVTWKVSNNLFQHLSVHEVQHGISKEYIVEHKRYADLDQLIFQHVQAIAKHVDEMTKHPKFREGTMAEVNEWLESYTKANPKNSAYVFCFDHKMPGWFLLLFKVNANTPSTTWHVKTESDGYRLKGFSYPNMLRLCNGFKQTFKSYVKSSRSSRTLPVNNQPQASAYGSYGY